MNLRAVLGGVGTALGLTLFPARCWVCDAPQTIRTPHGLCAVCHEVVPVNDGARCAVCDLPAPLATCARCVAVPRAFTRLRAPYVYGGGVRDLITAGKFRAREDVWAGLAALSFEDLEVRTLLEAGDLLVPVPLGAQRRRSRGYNQSAHLARHLGKLTKKPVVHALQRMRNTTPQSDLPLAERTSNVREAFAPIRSVLSATAILIDDVVTSGETVHQAARALQQAGLQHVMVVAVARAIEASDATTGT